MATEEQTDVQPTLLFIPDISGFTKFVADNEIQHSRHIVEELLEVLIDSNEMGLQVSEIEGDAILFYRQGVPPTAAEILAQVQRMYVNFHAHLRKYETHRICQCGACKTANNLSLKFITHFGDITLNAVKHYTKLFGKDVIVAHRLMKNTIDFDEYLLLTHDLIRQCSSWVEIGEVAWDQPRDGEGEYDDELVKYCYLPLKPLETHIPEPRIEDYAVKGADTKALQVEGVINAPMEFVFNLVSDVTNRHLWIAGVKSSGEHNGKITKNGSTHRCIMSDTPEKDPYFVSHHFDVLKDVITWVESDHNAKWNVVIKLERIGKQLTRIYYTFFIPSNFIYRMKFNFKNKKMLDGWVSGNFKNLDALCRKLMSEGKGPFDQIATGVEAVAG